MRDKLDQFISWFYIWRIWGPRCSEFDSKCIVCKEWARHDWMFGGPWAEKYIKYVGDPLDVPLTGLMRRGVITKK